MITTLLLSLARITAILVPEGRGSSSGQGKARQGKVHWGITRHFEIGGLSTVW